MKLKFIQINIYKGKFLDALVDFLKEEKPDFISMQEVTTNKLNNCSDKTLNLFEYIKEKLGYDGVYNGDTKLVDDQNSSFGNAVLTKLPVVGSNVVILNQFRSLTLSEMDHGQEVWPHVSRHVLDLLVKVDEKNIHAMSWHGAWTAPPQDTEITVNQAQKVADYLKGLGEPFILGVDMNAIMQSKAVETVSEAANNLMIGSGVLQTTHPKVHKIVPRGFLVDYIFTSPEFKLKSLRVPQVTISDHLPVIAELEI